MYRILSSDEWAAAESGLFALKYAMHLLLGGAFPSFQVRSPAAVSLLSIVIVAHTVSCVAVVLGHTELCGEPAGPPGRQEQPGGAAQADLRVRPAHRPSGSFPICPVNLFCMNVPVSVLYRAVSISELRAPDSAGRGEVQSVQGVPAVPAVALQEGGRDRRPQRRGRHLVGQGHRRGGLHIPFTFLLLWR